MEEGEAEEVNPEDAICIAWVRDNKGMSQGKFHGKEEERFQNNFKGRFERTR